MAAVHRNASSSHRLATDGYLIVDDVVDAQAIFNLTAILAECNDGQPHAQRNLLQFRPIRAYADSPAMRALIAPHLGSDARPVRGILFDKTPDANWKVAWHQDRSIAVKHRVELPGYGPWSIKAGVQHVQPPVDVLQNMLTARLHLDDCGPDNGPLRVIPGSHAVGVLSDESIADWRSKRPEVACTCRAGGVLLMRPLLLHASSSAISPRHRRVIHIEYAAGRLPGELEWFEN